VRLRLLCPLFAVQLSSSLLTLILPPPVRNLPPSNASIFFCSCTCFALRLTRIHTRPTGCCTLIPTVSGFNTLPSTLILRLSISPTSATNVMALKKLVWFHSYNIVCFLLVGHAQRDRLRALFFAQDGLYHACHSLQTGPSSSPTSYLLHISSLKCSQIRGQWLQSRNSPRYGKHEECTKG
jgi:hypothetical protein